MFIAFLIVVFLATVEFPASPSCFWALSSCILTPVELVKPLPCFYSPCVSGCVPNLSVVFDLTVVFVPSASVFPVSVIGLAVYCAWPACSASGPLVFLKLSPPVFLVSLLCPGWNQICAHLPFNYFSLPKLGTRSDAMKR